MAMVNDQDILDSAIMDFEDWKRVHTLENRTLHEMWMFGYLAGYRAGYSEAY